LRERSSLLGTKVQEPREYRERGVGRPRHSTHVRTATAELVRENKRVWVFHSSTQLLCVDRGGSGPALQPSFETLRPRCGLFEYEGLTGDRSDDDAETAFQLSVFGRDDGMKRAATLTRVNPTKSRAVTVQYCTVSQKRVLRL
jgi:hypothetical protein